MAMAMSETSRPATPSSRSMHESTTTIEPILGTTSNVRVAIRVRPLNKRGSYLNPLFNVMDQLTQH
jgi:hypothetical protein